MLFVGVLGFKQRQDHTAGRFWRFRRKEDIEWSGRLSLFETTQVLHRDFVRELGVMSGRGRESFKHRCPNQSHSLAVRIGVRNAGGRRIGDLLVKLFEHPANLRDRRNG